jgi:predicted N-acetyltransferase YhbS
VLTVDFPKDGYPETLHLGAFVDGELVGIATICREASPDEDRKDAWQLRAIGVNEAVKGRGIGQTLVDKCLEYV